MASGRNHLSARQPSSIIALSVNHQVCVLMNICHFHARANTTRRKAWFHLYMSRIFAAKRRWTILCINRPLFSGSYFQIFRSRDGSRPMKIKKNLHRIIISFISQRSQTFHVCWTRFLVVRTLRQACKWRPMVFQITSMEKT